MHGCRAAVQPSFVGDAEDVNGAGRPEDVLPLVAGDVERRALVVQTDPARQALLVLDRDVGDQLECGVERHDAPVAHVDDEDALARRVDRDVAGVVQRVGARRAALTTVDVRRRTAGGRVDDADSVEGVVHPAVADDEAVVVGGGGGGGGRRQLDGVLGADEFRVQRDLAQQFSVVGELTQLCRPAARHHHRRARRHRHVHRHLAHRPRCTTAAGGAAAAAAARGAR